MSWTRIYNIQVNLLFFPGFMAAPDGGWGWLVVFASFIFQAITIGIPYSFGIIMVELLNVFDSSESIIAPAGSIQIGIMYSTGKYIFIVSTTGNTI